MYQRVGGAFRLRFLLRVRTTGPIQELITLTNLQSARFVEDFVQLIPLLLVHLSCLPLVPRLALLFALARIIHQP